MTPEERGLRLKVGAEIIESAILDFLREHPDDYFNTGQVYGALVGTEFEGGWKVCSATLLHLEELGRF